mgnify:CR=1 FL=1
MITLLKILIAIYVVMLLVWGGNTIVLKLKDIIENIQTGYYDDKRKKRKENQL